MANNGSPEPSDARLHVLEKSGRSVNFLRILGQKFSFRCGVTVKEGKEAKRSMK